MPTEHDADADDLPIRRRSHGLDRWADKLQNDLAVGATGSEILMALRHTMTQLLEAEDALPRELRQEATRQIQALTTETSTGVACP